MKDDIEIGKRLRKLRKDAHLKQTKLFDELTNIIDEDAEFSDSEYPKQTISKLENGVIGLSLKKAVAYKNFFNVSLDYLYLGTKSYKPEYDDIEKMLGFSNDALHKLEELNKNDKRIIDILNKLLSSSLSPMFIELLSAFSEHSYIKTKSLVSQYPGNTFLTVADIKGYYKKPIILKPDDLEYQSLFKISEISKSIANELKKNGGK